MRINVEGPPLEKWDASSAIDTWYNDKSRRLTASSRATSTTGHGSKDTPTEKGDKHAFSLDEWKDWVQVSIDEEPNDDDDDDDDEEPLSFVDDEPCESGDDEPCEPGDDEPCEPGDDCVIIE